MSYNPNFAGVVEIEKATSVSTQETNNTGVTLTKLTPVRINSSGELATVDVTNEAHVDALIGIVADSIGNGNTGDVSNTGRITNISTSANVGDKLYINKSGALTSTKPTIGTASFASGDFVVAVGVVLQNATTPANKDLMVNIQVIGQL